MTRTIEMSAVLDTAGEKARADFDHRGVSLSCHGKGIFLNFEQMDALVDEYRRFQRLQALADKPVGVEDLPLHRSAA